MTTTQDTSRPTTHDYGTLRMEVRMAESYQEQRTGDGWYEHQEVETLTAAAKRLDAMLEDAVTTMRSHGQTWAQVAHALGVTKQAAQQKYGK